MFLQVTLAPIGCARRDATLDGNDTAVLAPTLSVEIQARVFGHTLPLTLAAFYAIRRTEEMMNLFFVMNKRFCCRDLRGNYELESMYAAERKPAS